jgi:flagella basal body P-ring formation protein FlgA
MDTASSSPASSRSSVYVPGVVHDLGLEPFQIWAALLSSLVWLLLCGGAALLSPPAHAQAVVSPEVAVLQANVETLLQRQAMPQSEKSGQAKPWRVEVALGQLDPRLKLAPCDKVQAYAPDGMRMWGKTRVGLRCEQGAVHWNVFWPVTVKVWGQALVAVVPLRPGTPVAAADLRLAEVDLAAHPSPAMTSADEVVGRSVIRPISPGQGLRQEDIRARRWFAAGDPVRLIVKGAGFAVASEGTALTPGDEGQCARVRLDGGRIVCGEPVGQRQVEISL